MSCSLRINNPDDGSAFSYCTWYLYLVLLKTLPLEAGAGKLEATQSICLAYAGTRDGDMPLDGSADAGGWPFLLSTLCSFTPRCLSSAVWSGVVEVLDDAGRQARERSSCTTLGSACAWTYPLSLQEMTPSGSQRFIGTGTLVNLGRGDIGFFQRHTFNLDSSPCPLDMVQGSYFKHQKVPAVIPLIILLVPNEARVPVLLFNLIRLLETRNLIVFSYCFVKTCGPRLSGPAIIPTDHRPPRPRVSISYPGAVPPGALPGRNVE